MLGAYVQQFMNQKSAVRSAAVAAVLLAATLLSMGSFAAPAQADHCQAEELVVRAAIDGWTSPVADYDDPRCQVGAHLSCPNMGRPDQCTIGAMQSTFSRVFGSGCCLYSGETLRAGDYLISNDGRYRLIMQDTGDLELIGPSGLEWSTSTGLSYMGWLVNQLDGNLVIYAANATPVWSTNTFAGSSTLVVQNDGNIVLYGPGGPVWSRW
jgi:hypothetical protein